MNNIYSNNQEVLDFITKAQNKIADLATLLVERAGEITPLDILALELIDFIEALDNPLTDWELDDVIRWIHEYKYRANLGELSYLNIYGYNTTLIQNVVGTGNITSSNITDFELAVINIIKAFPHNNLAQIQGGIPTERYHLTKSMYDYLSGLTSTPASVSLILTTNAYKWPSGYYEIGTNIEVVNLAGGITYSTNKKATYFEYKKGNTVLGTRNSNPTTNQQPNPISDTVGVLTDTTYSFNANFTDGLKTATQSIAFRQPMFYGLIKRDKLSSQTLDTGLYQRATKDVRDRGEMTLSFDVPVGNTSIEYNASDTLFIFIPSAWGVFTSAINNNFDFAGDFTSQNHDMTLIDGSKLPGLLLSYNTQVEGLVTFKFNW